MSSQSLEISALLKSPASTDVSLRGFAMCFFSAEWHPCARCHVSEASLDVGDTTANVKEEVPYVRAWGHMVDLRGPMLQLCLPPCQWPVRKDGVE